MSPQAEPFELLEWQRSKLVEFVHQFDRTYGDSSFDPQDEFSDPAIIARALRAAELMNFQGEALERFFEHEFALIGISQGELKTVLALAQLADAERRVRCAGGGRN
jgi:hypothetical protein